MPLILTLLLLLLRIPNAAAAVYPEMAEPYLSIWEDPTARVEFDQIDDLRFSPATAERLNAGYTSSALWLRLELSNSSTQKLERFLEMELDTISRFDVYRRGVVGPLQSGGQQRAWSVAQDHRHPVVDVSLGAQERGVWYIRLQNNYSLCIIAWLHSIDSLSAKESRESILLGTYTGLILFALVLALYLALSTRHSSFLLFGLVLATYHLFFQLTNFGLSWIYLWPDATSWADRATFVSIEVANIAAILFIRPSLELSRTMPRVDRWLWIPLAKSFLFLAWSLVQFTPALVGASVQIMGLSLLFYYGIGVYLWLKGYSPARYFSIGWLTVILFDVLSIMQAADLVRFDQPWFRSAVRFDLMLLSGSLQAVFLAIAIGDQFRQVQNDRESEGSARRKLEKSLDDAHVVQEAFIPSAMKSGRFEIVTAHRPSAKLGGDWLGYYHDPLHKRLILAISDVTGHGLPAALLSGAIHGSFYGLTRTEEVDNLSAAAMLAMILHRINDVVCMTAGNTSLIATMVILAVDLETGRLDYINAGHTPIVLVRSNKPEYILRGGSPLGLGGHPSFGVGHYAGRPGDMLFLYTDGLLDNTKGQRRMQLHHLSQLLSSQEPLSAIQARLEKLAGPDTTALEDDYSYIICRLEAA